MKKIKYFTFHANKGGVGKTTITLNVASELAKQGKKVLIMDFDSQGSISNVLKANEFFNENLSGEWLKRNVEVNLLINTIQKSKIKNIYIVPTNFSLNKTRNELINLTLRELVLSNNIKKMQSTFKELAIDYVFFDLNPIFDDIAKNVYIASTTGIIQVIEPHIFSLQGLNTMLEQWESDTLELGLNNNIQGIILNRLKFNKISKDFLDFIHSNYKNKVFNTYIPDNAGISSSTIKNIYGSDIKTLNKWKKPKWVLETELSNYISDGNPINNLVKELEEREII